METKSSSEGFLSEFRVLKEYWQALTIAGSIMFFGIYIYMENREYRMQVEILTQSNEQLKERINRLEGQLEVVNQSVDMFLQNNPDVLKYRLEKLERQIERGSDRTLDLGIAYDAMQFKYMAESQLAMMRSKKDTTVNTPKEQIPASVMSGDLEQKASFFKRLLKKKEK